MHGTQIPKARLRADLLARRKALLPAEVASHSGRILAHLRTLPVWNDAREILMYLPVKNEVDTTPLLDELWGRSVRLLLPRCRPDQPGVMDVACATCAEEIAPGMHGIREPQPEQCPSLATCHPDLILVPGVGFDRRGFRLGFGAGFYDRFLAGECSTGATVIGLAYGFQLVDELPADPWDIPMHAIITEDGILWI
ncbi:5-formyltetrahydrofolate cyclo-ligase [Desulfobaculum xiamenense]|uniref:5-formyltetrahydrofolate cyclo-ligase n=1 Tax=Desulfobaculum xiamenense TaxID=995050 RepID=A0A846QMN0_9BACT|nr:5-formyltetrahydrofolate cyclo-ligase [Desulfobaculum xiamenense]NJB69361.1 5-formyltetrahydrofolate cyclo-ligase [Desulfobaculum xiamenense]